ncbi:Shikimate dehydrogenase, partial [Pseudomonas syringae pv. maculicola]|jgi:hypothetical protein
MHR